MSEDKKVTSILFRKLDEDDNKILSSLRGIFRTTKNTEALMKGATGFLRYRMMVENLKEEQQKKDERISDLENELAYLKKGMKDYFKLQEQEKTERERLVRKVAD